MAQKGEVANNGESQTSRQLKFLFCGKTGLGKSSLINTLIGKKVFEVDDAGLQDFTDDVFEGCTKKIQFEKKRINGVDVYLYDSPGLLDGKNNDEMYLEQMHRYCHDSDLILFCIDFTLCRWTEHESQATKLLTDKFGKEVWRKVILVATKANRVYIPGNKVEDKPGYCETLLQNLQSKLHVQLGEHNVPRKIVDDIPAVTAGYVDFSCSPPSTVHRFVWFTSKKADYCSEESDFYPEFWVTCFERIAGLPRECFVKVTNPSLQCIGLQEKEKILLKTFVNDFSTLEIIDEEKTLESEEESVDTETQRQVIELDVKQLQRLMDAMRRPTAPPIALVVINDGKIQRKSFVIDIFKELNEKQ